MCCIVSERGQRGTIVGMSSRLPELHYNGAPVGELETAPSDAAPVEITCAPVEGAIAAVLMVGGEELGPPATRLGESVWRWQWRPRGRAGAFGVRLSVGFADQTTATREETLTVVAGKLGQAEFAALLAALQQVAAGLLYALGGGMFGVALAPGAEAPRSLVEEYASRLLHEARLAKSITAAIARQPSTATRQELRRQTLEELVEIGPETLARLLQQPFEEYDAPGDAPFSSLPPVGAGGKLPLPRTVPVRATQRTTDMYEHALLARLLRELQWRCAFIREALRDERRWREHSSSGDGGITASLHEWEAQLGAIAQSLQRCRGASFLVDVAPVIQWRGMSPLMRRDPRYRDIGRLWRMVVERPFVALQSPWFDLPVDDLPALYEQWCLLEVARVLQTVGTPLEQQLFRPVAADYAGIPGMAWRVQLREDRPLLRRRCGARELAVYYRRRYRPHIGHTARLGSLDPFTRIPDIVIEITAPERRPAVLVFDAKYRVAPSGGIPEDALADAYAYRSAIGCVGEPASLGSYLLFPGAEGFTGGGVGAISLVPGHENVLEAIIHETIGVC